MRLMTADKDQEVDHGQDAAGGLAAYESDLRRAERKVAGEIDPGMRAVVVAVGVLVAMLSMVLPHTGTASGIEVLTFAPDADAERVTITSEVFVYLLTIFGIGVSAFALLTRRWLLAWIALCGNAVACVAGMLAWWSRNTPGVGGIEPPSGVGIGLIIGWLAVLVLTFHWARVVWARSTYHLALEEQRRKEAATRDAVARSLQLKPDRDA
jgi:preprotein translocase subunit Sec61beta